MNSILKIFRQAFLLTAVLMVMCSVVYPLALTSVSQAAFHGKANGSILEVNDIPVGSALIGQDFTDARFLRGRISAVNYNTYDEGDTGYGGVASGSFNYAASNPALVERVEQSMEAFLAANPGVRKEDIPTDLLTASGSGLDPHISPASARLQTAGISKATGIDQVELLHIIEQNTEHKLFGVLGEETVNVLKVNLEIADRIGMINQ